MDEGIFSIRDGLGSRDCDDGGRGKGDDGEVGKGDDGGCVMSSSDWCGYCVLFPMK